MWGGMFASRLNEDTPSRPTSSLPDDAEYATFPFRRRLNRSFQYETIRTSRDEDSRFIPARSFRSRDGPDLCWGGLPAVGPG